MMTSKLYCSYYLSKTFVNLHLHYMYICTWTYLHTFWHVHIHVYKRHDCIILCFEFLYNGTHTLLNDNYMTAIDQVLEITVIVKTKGSIKLYVYSVYICLYMYIKAPYIVPHLHICIYSEGQTTMYSQVYTVKAHCIHITH